MVKRPTITDLARHAGVSVATVDRVLNRRLPVREDTALRVVGAAEAIGYHATGLLKRRMTEVPRRTLGFLLQKRHDSFYQAFGAELVKATKGFAGIDGKPFVDFVDELLPARIAARIRDMSERADALAIVAVDHPTVNEAVDDVVSRGKKVFTLLSDITTPKRSCYLAVDTRRAGRTAAWSISRLAKVPGKVGILLGSHRYLSQEISEISFRSYMREHAPAFQLLEPIINLDDEHIAYEAVCDMLASNPDLVGIYASGGGQEGLIRALRDEGAGRGVVAICNELVAATRSALIDGVIDLALRTPIEAMSARAVALMAQSLSGPESEIPQQVLFPADIFISENI
jgi:LacI family transcriptional regulator